MVKLLTKEDRQYADYLTNHQKNVQIAFYEFINHNYIYDMLINKFRIDIDINELEYRVLQHDASKWSKAEFMPYRQYYYPTTFASKELLNKAWIHHFMNNDHHPEYWIIDKDIDLILKEQFTGLESEDMSIEAILEMICDWIAMSLYFNSSLITWYYNEGSKYPFSILTRNIVENIIDILDKKYNLEYRVLTYIPNNLIDFRGIANKKKS